MSHSRWTPSSRSMDYKSPLHSSLLRIPRSRNWLPMILVAVAASALTFVLTSQPLPARGVFQCHSTVGPIVLRQHDIQSRTPIRNRPAVSGGKEGSTRSDVDYSKFNPLEEIEQYVARLPSGGAFASPDDHHPAVKGPPTPNFRENLLPDRKYITTFHDAGWTNQIMMIANMIYLGLHTQHTPILPPFMAMHVGLSEGSIAFSDIFDLPRLERSMGIDILDWTQVKEFPIGTREHVASKAGPHFEEVGCWSSWAPTPDAKAAGASYRPSDVPYLLGLDVSYTPVPESVTTGQWNHLSQWNLAALGYPGGRAEALRGTSSLTTTPSRNGHRPVPDEQLMCFDFLYYVSMQEAWDWQREWSPQWNIVLRHLHWTPKMNAIAIEALSHLLGFDSRTTTIPPYIAIHARHGDFKNQCLPGTAPEDCFPPFSDMEDAVDRIRRTLKTQNGIDVDPRNVLVASDEKSDMWWSEVQVHGWKRIDHSSGALDTGSKHGKWYEVFIDAAIMSKAKGFVGTTGSTFSELAARRVQGWGGGVTAMVRRPGA